MIIAIFGAIIWLVLCFYASPADVALLAPMAVSYLLAGGVPIWLKHRHIKAQNGLLERCRVLLVAGSQALSQGDRAVATTILVRIRRIERVWRFGNSRAFRICLALWAIGTAVVLCISTRYMALLVHYEIGGGRPPSAHGVREQLILAGAVSMSAPVHALISYCSAWREPWVIDDCGDRLWHLLHGARAVATFSVARQRNVRPNHDGLSSREIFGLGPGFTRRELDAARRRLVRHLHPDHQHSATPTERRACEEALKRVNAAYDMLISEAG